MMGVLSLIMWKRQTVVCCYGIIGHVLLWSVLTPLTSCPRCQHPVMLTYTWCQRVCHPMSNYKTFEGVDDVYPVSNGCQVHLITVVVSVTNGTRQAYM